MAGIESRTQSAFRAISGNLGAAPESDDLFAAAEMISAEWGDVSAVLSADYYDAQRELAGVSGRFAAEPSESTSRDRLEGIVRRALVDGQTVPAQLDLLAGMLARAVVSVGRDTVRDNVRRDPAATGWKRIARPDACSFCRMLAGRGEVYRADTARFASHGKKGDGSGGNCLCTAAPAWGRGLAVTVGQYVATKRNVTAHDRARIREYLAAEYGA